MILCYINVVSAEKTWDKYVPMGVPGLRATSVGLPENCR